MKIAQVCFRYNAPGGVEDRVCNISKELLKRGHEVIVYTTDLYTEVPWRKFKNWRPVEEINGIVVKRFKVYKNVFPSVRFPIIPEMISALIKSDCRIFDAHSHRYFQLYAVAIAHYATKKPFVVTTHFHPPELNETFWKKIALKLEDYRFGWDIYRYAKKIITVTEYEKKYISSFVDTKKCITIPNGISEKEWQNIPSEKLFCEKYNISPPYILYAGRLASNKGLLYLTNAIPKVLKRNDVKFVFIGKDWGERKKIIALARKLNIEESIIFTDYIEDFALYKSAFKGCELLVLPSEWEAFGIVLLEAMICEKPVIGTSVGGIPEIIEDGKNGLLVPYGNVDELAKKINYLLENKQVAKKLSAEGKRKVLRNYTWQKIVEKLERLYLAVCE